MTVLRSVAVVYGIANLVTIWGKVKNETGSGDPGRDVGPTMSGHSLRGLNNGLRGHITSITGAVVDVLFRHECSVPSIYNALEVDGITLEVQQHLGDCVVRTIAMRGSLERLSRGLTCIDSGAAISVPVGAGTLGRSMDVLGNPIDEAGPIVTKERWSIHRPPPTEEAGSNDLVRTGIKVIDLLCPLAKGGKVALFGGASDGMMDLMRHIAIGHMFQSVFAIVGERNRTREGTTFRHEMEDSNVLDKVTLVYGQMNWPPRNRLRIALAGLTMAEKFRGEGQDVLLFVDNNYSSTPADTPASALLGPHPTLAEDMDALHERITSTKTGSITSIQAVYAPAEDFTNHFDAIVVLSRDIASLGIYPSIDPLDSTSRQMDSTLIGADHYNTAGSVKQILRQYKSLQEVISIIGVDALSPLDKQVVSRARKIQGFLSQPSGKYVSLGDTIAGCNGILNGEFDHLPNEAFYMVGGIEEAAQKARCLPRVDQWRKVCRSGDAQSRLACCKFCGV